MQKKFKNDIIFSHLQFELEFHVLLVKLPYIPLQGAAEPVHGGVPFLRRLVHDAL